MIETRSADSKVVLLSSWFFLLGPVRCGRLGIAISRTPVFNRTLNRYRATGQWTSIDIGWLRFYWYDRPAPVEPVPPTPLRAA